MADADEGTGPGPLRRVVALAGHGGDVATARRGLSADDPSVRATALRAMSRLGSLTASDVAPCLADPDPDLRRAACEVLARPSSQTVDCDLRPVLADEDPLVVEAAAFALGERAEVRSIPDLARTAASHADPLCRESAVAAIGAIAAARTDGGSDGLDAVLGALSDRREVRRRAVVSLAAFEGEGVTAALRRALDDRDWQVRQAAEDLLGNDAGGESPSD